MNKNKIIALKKPGQIAEDPLTELLRKRARQLIADAHKGFHPFVYLEGQTGNPTRD